MVSSTRELPDLAPRFRRRRLAARPAGPVRLLARAMRRSKQGMIGATIVGALTFIAICAPILAPADPGKPVLSQALQSPSRSAPFGTDELGRDLLGRIIHGARASLSVAAIAMGISLLVGAPVGLVAGYWSGATGSVLMRLMDALQAFPGVLLAVAIASTLGPGLRNATIAIGVVGIPAFARLARGETLRLRSTDFITAAVASGAGHWRIMTRHIVPNGVAPLIVAVATGSAAAILTEAALSFVGLGASPPHPSWGGMLQSGYPFLQLAPWLSVFPGAVIALTTLGFIFLGDGLRDTLDPRLRGR